MGKKQELGKGIRALLQSMDAPETDRQSQDKNAEGISMIPLSEIRRNSDQPRQEFDEESLKELAQSIKSLGVIQPLTLRKISDQDYQIIAGERRFRASQLAGLEKVPAYVREADDVELLEMALVENIQRKDLNPIEVAISFDRLIRECGITQEELSDRVGKKRSTIANYVRLLKLPPEVQKALKKELISMGHARALAGVDDPYVLMAHFKTVLEKGLSVRSTEALVQNPGIASGGGSKKMPSTHPEIRRIQDRLSNVFGSKVLIDRNEKGQGKIVIPFGSDAQFNDILEQLED